MISPTFHTLITQPTTLCNLDCAYCYLPNRKQDSLMSPAAARALAASVKEQDRYPVDVVWHGGEPLATPIEHMRELLAPFESLRGLVKHGVQTNATLVDDAWCELLRAHRFDVGISIDGPAIHNAARGGMRVPPTAIGWRLLRRRASGSSITATRSKISESASRSTRSTPGELLPWWLSSARFRHRVGRRRGIPVLSVAASGMPRRALALPEVEGR